MQLQVKHFCSHRRIGEISFDGFNDLIIQLVLCWQDANRRLKDE